MSGSAIYKGAVRHRRFSPKSHDFSYQIFMPLLDLDELPELLKKTRFWSSSGFALAQFRAKDYFPEASTARDIKHHVIKQASKVQPDIEITRVSMLANLRYFGFIFNPIACYYCFNQEDQLCAIVAQVTNTPWLEKHCYVIPCDVETGMARHCFDKEFHVSPFMPMEMQYHWFSKRPDMRLTLHMENHADGQKAFDATMLLEHQGSDAQTLDKHILLYPLMTIKVVAAIYWQAIRQFLKGFRFYNHPNSKLSEPSKSNYPARKPS